MSNRYVSRMFDNEMLPMDGLNRTYNKLWVDTQASIKDVINIEDQHQLGRPERERYP